MIYISNMIEKYKVIIIIFLKERINSDRRKKNMLFVYSLYVCIIILYQSKARNVQIGKIITMKDVSIINHHQ